MPGDIHSRWNESGKLPPRTQPGMKLTDLPKVSYEYIACQQERQGAMILSEFAGAAQSLNGSIVVNPWDSQQVADAIHEAVTMSPETRSENHKKLFKVCISEYVCATTSLFLGAFIVRDQVFRSVLGNLVCWRNVSDQALATSRCSP